MEIRFNGTVGEVKAELHEFIGTFMAGEKVVPTPVKEPKEEEKIVKVTISQEEPKPAEEPKKEEPQVQGLVPTVSASYTMDDLTKMAASLMHKGMGDQLTALVQSYGVKGLTKIPEEHFGAVAQELKALGADV